MDELDTMINDLVPHPISGRRFLFGLLLGFAGGASAAALLLPRSGPALRQWLNERATALVGQIRHILAGEDKLGYS